MVIQNTDGTPQSSKATEVGRKRSQSSADAGPTAHTVGGQDLNTGKKPEDKQNAAEQWKGDDLKDPRPTNPS